MSDPRIRRAGPDDAETIHRFITELAVYEREPDAVEATPASLRAQLTAPHPPFECLLAEVDGEPRGFALFFANYSTWRGKPGIYLEDLFVPERHRGAGLGRLLLATLARLTVERGGARLEWQVLDWNTPSIDFYRALGATVKDDWLPCRLDGTALDTLAASGTSVVG